jgi:hypothetical protein
MLISPSDLPWWGWLLCSLAAWIAFGIGGIMKIAARGEGTPVLVGCLGVLLEIASAAVGVVTGAIGIVLFARWVWNS